MNKFSNYNIVVISVFFLFIFIAVGPSDCGGEKKFKNKYSKEANELPPPPKETYDPDFRTLQKPYRMAKLNMVWAKAQQVFCFVFFLLITVI